MILLNLLKGMPFPFIVQTIDPYKVVCESSATLFDAPNYHGRNDEVFKEICGDGWKRCNDGYSVYSKRIPFFHGHVLIIHGLKIKGEWRSRGRDENFSIVISRDRVVDYVNALFASMSLVQEDFEGRMEDKVRSLVTDSTHEIRSMNASLYHAAYELQSQLKYESSHKLALAKNVVALSELISARIELADMAASQSEAFEVKSCPPVVVVWKKFEKITKCYIAYAKRRNISINITGSSRGSTTGGSNFDMIPLVVVDNAVKYCPSKSEVTIDIRETDAEIICRVTSLGPKIEETEKQRIFDREFRGSHAESSGKSGAGIGLFFARTLLSAIDGKITVSQEEAPSKIDGRIFYSTAFEMRFSRV